MTTLAEAPPCATAYPVMADDDDAPLLFCPFCRECFEGEELCPDHELALVAFDRLPRTKEDDAPPGEHEVLAVYDLRFGRGILYAAAVLALVGFVLPMVETSSRSDSIVSTGIDVASRVAPNLFLIPALAFGLMSILYRRRTAKAMRGARVVVPALALLGAGSLAVTLYRIHQGAEQMSARLGAAVEVESLSGVWVMGISLAVALVGGVLFGRLPQGGEPYPQGSEAEGPGDIIVDE